MHKWIAGHTVTRTGDKLQHSSMWLTFMNEPCMCRHDGVRREDGVVEEYYQGSNGAVGWD